MAVAWIADEGLAGGSEGLGNGESASKVGVKGVHHGYGGTGVDLPAGGDDVRDAEGGEGGDEVAHAVIPFGLTLSTGTS